MNKILRKLWIIPLTIAIFPIVSTSAQEIDPQVNDIINHLVGRMDTSAQNLANPSAPNVRMTTCVVEVSGIENEVNSIYLYQEQALSNQLNQPYRQRFLEIRPVATEEKVESTAFKPINPQKWVNLCDRPETQRNVNSFDLGEAVCTVSLRPLMTIYIGETPPEGCPTNVRGAVRITNTVILHSQGMDTFDRGFDAQGNQVWGAENQGYQFRWITQ